MLNSKCEAVANPIANCKENSGAQTCFECESGYILSLDNKSCVAITPIDNCNTYTNVKCLKCKDTFLSEDKYQEKLI